MTCKTFLESQKQLNKFRSQLNKNMQEVLNKTISAIVDGLGIPRATAATVFLTLFTFSLGYLLTWLVTGLTKYKKRRLYRKSLKTIIQDFLNSCEKQYLEFECFPSQAGYLNGGNYTISIASSYSHNYLAKTDITIFIENFSSIFDQNRAFEISQLFECVEQVAAVKDSLQKVVEFVQIKYSENFNLYNENLDNLRRLHDDLIFEFTKSNGTIIRPTEFEIFIKNVFVKWKKAGGITHISATLSEIVNPLYERAIMSSPTLSSKHVIDCSLKCRLAVTNIESYEKYLKESISQSLEIHKKVFDRCSSFITKW